jgi:DNA-directed RNA polymerase II subunit RPB3
MNPVLSQHTLEDSILKFRISGINVSLANALRRIIIAEIPTIVFRTTPHDKNLADITINTTRMNNEIIKQRLSCVPIHITDTEFPLQDYIVEVEKKNTSDTIDFVTTKDFKIKNIQTNTYVKDAERDKIFPTDPITGDYIDLVRLRPKLSDEIDGEHLKLTCKLDIGTAREDGAFNVVSTCAYAASPDPIKINAEWTEKSKLLKKEGMSKEEIEFAEKDWRLLDAKRYTMSDTFDFIVESVGVFSNESIVFKASHVMMDKLKLFIEDIQSKSELVEKANSTIPNCFDITLINEDYTLGKVLEFILYSKHYDRSSSVSDKSLSYCGFRKPHPHISVSVIRLGFNDEVDSTVIVSYLINAATDAIKVYEKIAEHFKE